MSKRLPMALALSLAALGVATAALPGAAAENRPGPIRAGCAADNPAITKLVDAVKGIDAVLADPGKLQTVLGDVYTAIIGAQQAGCLPALPTTPAPPPQRAADACLAPTVELLGAVLGGVSATLKTPPDANTTNAAVSRLGSAVTGVNTGNCLPVALSVPGGGGPPPASPLPPAPPLPPGS